LKALLRRATTLTSGLPPPLILAALYAVRIVLGAAILMLPVSRTVLIPWSVAMFAFLEWNNPGTLGQSTACLRV
jgi:trk system potassium uptake protein TrkH